MKPEHVQVDPSVVESVEPLLLDHLKGKVAELVNSAQAIGAVLTIEVQPKQPLAMGNYTLRCELRKARVLACPAR